MTPTIVLVHGAYADSTSWEGLVGLLPADGRVIAFANPLHGLATDTALLTRPGEEPRRAGGAGRALLRRCRHDRVPADAGDVVGLRWR